MKKFFCFILTLLIFTGCMNMNNTPTKKVEEFLNKYQTNDSDVLSDLQNVLISSNLTENERDDYLEFMKKHYQDMKYKIKEEKIDGDSATVNVEITVRDYSSVVNDANKYRMENKDKFNEKNTFASYRLEKLKKVTETQTYTLTFYLNKVKEEWKINPLTQDDESKLNGLFGVNDVNSEISDTNNTDSRTNNETRDTNNTDSQTNNE